MVPSVNTLFHASVALFHTPAIPLPASVYPTDRLVHLTRGPATSSKRQTLRTMPKGTAQRSEHTTKGGRDSAPCLPHIAAAGSHYRSHIEVPRSSMLCCTKYQHKADAAPGAHGIEYRPMALEQQHGRVDVKYGFRCSATTYPPSALHCSIVYNLTMSTLDKSGYRAW
jgi:hypothetical protein